MTYSAFKEQDTTAGRSALPQVPSFAKDDLCIAKAGYNQAFKKGDGSAVWQDHVMTGFFPNKPGLPENEANAAKAATLFFDIDLKEVILQDSSFVEQARAWFATAVESNNKITTGLSADAPTIKQVERFLWQSDEETITSLVTPYVNKFLAIMKPILGKPSMILYSGHVSHIHYNLCDEDGWTEEWAKKYKAHGVRSNYAHVKALHEQLISHVNKQPGSSFQFEGNTYRLVDSAAKGVAARKCSEIGFVNKKCYFRMKEITPMMAGEWEAGRRIDVEAVQFEVVSNFAQQVNSAANGSSGSPANVTKDGAAKGKVTPRRMSAEYKLIARGVDGSAVQCTADQLIKAIRDKDDSLFKLEEDTGNVVGRVKVKCRPLEDNPPFTRK